MLRSNNVGAQRRNRTPMTGRDIRPAGRRICRLLGFRKLRLKFQLITP